MRYISYAFAVASSFCIMYLTGLHMNQRDTIAHMTKQYAAMKHRADSLDLQCRAYVYGMKRTAESLNNYGVFFTFSAMKQQALMYAAIDTLPIVVEPTLTLKDIKHKD